MKEDALSSFGLVKVLCIQPETCGGESMGIHQHFSDMLSLVCFLTVFLCGYEILLPRVCVQLKVSLVQI